MDSVDRRKRIVAAGTLVDEAVMILAEEDIDLAWVVSEGALVPITEALKVLNDG